MVTITNLTLVLLTVVKWLKQLLVSILIAGVLSATFDGLKQHLMVVVTIWMKTQLVNCDELKQHLIVVVTILMKMHTTSCDGLEKHLLVIATMLVEVVLVHALVAITFS